MVRRENRLATAFRPIALVALATLGLAACGSSSLGSLPTTTSAGPTTSTSTTIASILPPDGTIAGADLEAAINPNDIIATARRALATWTSTSTPCYPSKAEALAARDEFARLAAYFAKARTAARTIANLSAFKEVIGIETQYRQLAGKLTFVSCNKGDAETTGDKTKSTTTTSPAGNTKGLAAGGVAEVQLTISGTPKVESQFTVADTGSPCDGLSANTTYLVNSRDATGRWVITDVVTNTDGATSAVITPSRPGLAAIEYLAYCGTSDKRHGVITFSVKAKGDTTTSAPAPTTTNPTAPLVVFELPIDKSSKPMLTSSATEVAIEPDSVEAYLGAYQAEGGVVIARINEGDWVALSSAAVSWVPVGTGTSKLDVRIVGAKSAVQQSYSVDTPPTTTVARKLPTSTTVADESGTPGSNTHHTDTTLWVIIILMALAVVFVVAARGAQRTRRR